VRAAYCAPSVPGWALGTFNASVIMNMGVVASATRNEAELNMATKPARDVNGVKGVMDRMTIE
jgi:hypothetical protein